MEVTVGRIGRPHGIRGDVVVGVRTDEPELRFARGSQLDTDPADVGPLTVASRRWHSGELLVRFEGVADRDAAAGLRGTWLLVDSATFAPPDDPDEFHDTDLVGLSVRTLDGTQVGTVDDVLHPGQDLLVIKSPDGQEILIPFVKAFVPEIAVPSGFLVIDPPEGLLDLGSLLPVSGPLRSQRPGDGCLRVGGAAGLGGRLRVYSAASSIQRRSAAPSSPPGSTKTIPFMGRPVKSIGRTCGRSNAASALLGPSRTIRVSLTTPQNIWPFSRNASPPNIRRSLTAPPGGTSARIRPARSSS